MKTILQKIGIPLGLTIWLSVAPSALFAQPAPGPEGRDLPDQPSPPPGLAEPGPMARMGACPCCQMMAAPHPAGVMHPPGVMPPGMGMQPPGAMGMRPMGPMGGMGMGMQMGPPPGRPGFGRRFAMGGMGPGPREFTREEHLRQAIRHLRAAGMPEIAEKLQGMLQKEKAGAPEPNAVNKKIFAHLENMERQIKELHHQVEELRGDGDHQEKEQADKKRRAKKEHEENEKE